jgi:hypothetical protein
MWPYSVIKVGKTQSFSIAINKCLAGCIIFEFGWFYVEFIHKDCVCDKCKNIPCICMEDEDEII